MIDRLRAHDSDSEDVMRAKGWARDSMWRYAVCPPLLEQLANEKDVRR